MLVMDGPPILTRSDAYRRLNISEQSIVYWEKRGYIKRIEKGRQVWYPVAEVVAQAMKNGTLQEAAREMAVEFGLEPSTRDSPAMAATRARTASDQTPEAVEIALLRERVEAQEREIERLHETIQHIVGAMAK